MQIEVVEMKYILLWNIIGKKKSEKRVEKVERMRESKKFISCLGIHIIGDGKPFYRLPKWLPLIFINENINGTHK